MVDVTIVSEESNVRRKYVPNPKHTPRSSKALQTSKKPGQPTLMDLDDETAQKVLDEGIQHERNIYGYHDGRFYKFHYDNVGGYHGYPIKGKMVPNNVLNQMRDEGRITMKNKEIITKGL